MSCLVMYLLADLVTCLLYIKLGPSPSRRHERPRPQMAPPSQLRLEIVPLKLDELNPALIRQQIRSLALSKVLPAETNLAALPLKPVRVVDHEQGAKLRSECEQVHRYSRVQ